MKIEHGIICIVFSQLYHMNAHMGRCQQRMKYANILNNFLIEWLWINTFNFFSTEDFPHPPCQCWDDCQTTFLFSKDQEEREEHRTVTDPGRMKLFSEQGWAFLRGVGFYISSLNPLFPKRLRHVIPCSLPRFFFFSLSVI